MKDLKLKISALSITNLWEVDYLAFLFELEIQKNSPLNLLKIQKYHRARKLENSRIYHYLLPGKKIFIASLNQQIIGYISARIIKQQGKVIEKYLKIDDLFVLEEYRGRGVGKKLIKKMLVHFSKINICVLFAVPDKQITSHYKKLGFAKRYEYLVRSGDIRNNDYNMGA